MNLKSYLTKDDVIGSIRAQLRHPSGEAKVWVLVEGETDLKLFGKLLKAEQVEIEIAYGGLNCVLQVVSELVQETERVLGIRDADFLHLQGKQVTSEYIFLTDTHDAEMMLIACDNAYLAVVAEYFPKAVAPSRERLLESIAFLGGLRWINDVDQVELNFKGLGLGDFYDGNTITLDEQTCLSVVLNRSRYKKKDIPIDAVSSKVQGFTDFFNLCNGHDAQKALALCVSTHSKKGVNNAEIGRAFRLVYRFEDFQTTELYRRLRTWSHQRDIPLFNNEQED